MKVIKTGRIGQNSIYLWCFKILITQELLAINCVISHGLKKCQIQFTEFHYTTFIHPFHSKYQILTDPIDRQIGIILEFHCRKQYNNHSLRIVIYIYNFNMLFFKFTSSIMDWVAVPLV